MWFFSLQIAYLCSHTRELCSKPGRELLHTICAQQPRVMSYILRLTHESLDKVGLVSVARIVTLTVVIVASQALEVVDSVDKSVSHQDWPSQMILHATNK